MSAIEIKAVATDEEGIRLDRWFRRHYPDLTHGWLRKLLRDGQVRVDGRRASAEQRLIVGQKIRVPPSDRPANNPKRSLEPPVTEAETEMLRSLVLYRDPSVIVINKPSGLAVQGGPGTGRHLDAMLAALAFDGERPRLVHRLDRDTSGVLLLARSASAAASLAGAFRSGTVRKIYWALVVGIPERAEGKIDLALSKRGGAGRERVSPDEEEGRRAVTLYRVVERVGRKAAWLVLSPLTGRTHQIRAHCASLGTPIVGDIKYGGTSSLISGLANARRLHLHARRVIAPNPVVDTPPIDVTAPLPAHMAESWSFLGLEQKAGAKIEP
jgi:23S rRNA pseudouridine955/2504/2580 synthase